MHNMIIGNIVIMRERRLNTYPYICSMGLNAWTDSNYYISASYIYLNINIFHMNIKINILILDSDI